VEHLFGRSAQCAALNQDTAIVAAASRFSRRTTVDARESVNHFVTYAWRECPPALPVDRLNAAH
jgi:hypothetical protein